MSAIISCTSQFLLCCELDNLVLLTPLTRSTPLSPLPKHSPKHLLPRPDHLTQPFVHILVSLSSPCNSSSLVSYSCLPVLPRLAVYLICTLRVCDNTKHKPNNACTLRPHSPNNSQKEERINRPLQTTRCRHRRKTRFFFLIFFTSGLPTHETIVRQAGRLHLVDAAS
ncbi:hypothetical protein BC938DRAFT_480447 [Jimgerdemannia flammicorona]|uniref:Uncharacterized protein n=1 Tax=Jimgerdemannia flammicorona TaxID=994334 RepID=A0A433QIJ0_9FUNG|nr:hypothetical protein BC938DRAFT_480447 [Jimgerdemannia flammicorona]